MDFETVQYIDWFRENWHGIKFDMGTSGVHGVTNRQLNLDMGELNLGKTLFFGHSGLVDCISEIYGAEKNEILVTSGSTYGNYLACALHLSPGDEVIVEHPVYTPLLDVVKLFGAKVRFIERRFEDGYRLDVDELSTMVTKDTGMIVVTNLHNPSGVHMDIDTVKGISEIAEDTQTYVLSDEVYRDFILDDAAPVLSSLTGYGISTCSLSKFYGAGALRIGWLTCSSEMTTRARRMNDYLAVTPSCAGETYAAQILEKRDWFVERVREITANNYPIVRKWLRGREDLHVVLPSYGFIVFPRSINNIDSMKLAELLLSKYSTILSPGRFFGEEGHFRLGIGGEADSLRGALENLGAALDELG